ncbi:MAG: TonB-dependent receptor [Deltaproteobacteria bacterium]|nr:TonB-dependent receptor [Deltaproteobacteria bacterium]
MRQKQFNPSSFGTKFCFIGMSFLLSAVLTFFSFGSAIGEEPEPSEDYILEDTVVTATKRATSLQDTPQSISAFSSQDLDDMGVQSFSDMTDAIAGVEFRTQQAGLGSITMRGISDGLSTINGRQGGSAAAVGFYLDDMPLTMAGMLADVKSFDMERVEVLRGPQGTLYGEGSMAGTVRLIAEKPDSTAFATKADLTFSSTEEGGSNYIANAMVNVPLAEDKLALRVLGYYNERSGFIDMMDITTGALIKKDSNEDENIGFRAKMQFTPTDELIISATALMSTAERGPTNESTRDFIQRVSTPTNIDDDLQGYNLTVEYSLPFADLVSSTSYFNRETTGAVDQSGLVGGVNFVLGLFGMTPVTGVYIDQILDSNSFSQELRLVSKGDGPFNWIVGGFYKKQENEWNMEGLTTPFVDEPIWIFISTMMGLPPIGNGLTIGTTGEVEQYAAFGEISYDFNDRFQLLAGARIFTEDRETTSIVDGLFPFLMSGFLPGTFASTGEDDIFSPKVTATYKVTDDAMVYATYSEGFRGGGQNDFHPLVAGSVVSFDSETLNNYEIGLKSTWLANRLSFNVAGYYMKWKELQATVIEDLVGESIDNVGDAHTMGVEFEIVARPLPGLQLSVASNILEAEIDEDVELPAGDGSMRTLAKGMRIPNTADFKFHAAIQYWRYLTDSIAGFARLSYSHTGDAITWLEPSLVSTIPAYDVVSTRLGIETDRWSLALFVDNLFDEFIIYKDSVNVQPPSNPLREYSMGRPRTIGINLKFNF